MRVDRGEGHYVIKTQDTEIFPKCSDWQVDLSVDTALVEIPNDAVKVKSLDLAEARRWRGATREVFQAYFKSGFAAIDLIRGNEGKLLYIMKKVDLPPNIFADS